MGAPIALLRAGGEGPAVKAGKGFNTDTGAVVDGAACVEGSPWTAKFAGGEVARVVAAAPSAIEDALSFGPGGAAPYLVAGLDAGFLTKPTSDAEAALFGLTTVATRSKKLKTPKMTDAAAAAAATAGGDGGDAFREACGNGYVSEVRKGAALVWKALVHFEDAGDRAAWVEAAGYDAATGSLDADAINVTASFLRRANHSGEIFLDVAAQQFGGAADAAAAAKALAAGVGGATETHDGIVSWSCSTRFDKADRKVCAKQLKKLQTYATKGLAAAVAPQGNDAAPLAVVVSPYADVKGASDAVAAAAASLCDAACVDAISRVRAAIDGALRVVDLVDTVRRTCEVAGLAPRNAFEDLADAALDDADELRVLLKGCGEHPASCAANVADGDALRPNALRALEPKPAALATTSAADVEAWLAGVSDASASAVPYCHYAAATTDEDGAPDSLAVAASCDATPWGMRQDRAADVHKRLRNDNMYNYKDNPISLVIRNAVPGLRLTPHNSTALNEGKTWSEYECWDGDCGGGKPPAWIDKGKVHLIDPERDEEFPAVGGCEVVGIPIIEKHMKNAVYGCFGYDMDYRAAMRFLPAGEEGVRELAEKGLVYTACFSNPQTGVAKAFGAVWTRAAFVDDELRWKDVLNGLKEAAETPDSVKHMFGHKLTFEVNTRYAPTGHPAAIFTVELRPDEAEVVEVDAAHEWEL